MKILNFIHKYKRLLENIISLYSIQGLEYLLGLIIFPYLVMVLGPDKYGMIILCQTIINYFNLVVDYGFMFTGPRLIAINKNEKQAKIFMSIMATKFIICVFASMVLSIIYILLEKIYIIDKMVLYASYIVVIGNMLFPTWFFQGIEKMRYITIVNLIARMITTSFIFFIVKSQDDYIIAVILQSIVPLLAGIFSICILLKEYKYLFIKININDIIYQFKDGWSIFISNIFISIYTSSYIMVLGLFSSNEVIAYFGIIKKLIDCLMKVLGPVLQSVYPYINKLVIENKQLADSFIKKIAVIFMFIGFLLFIILYFGAYNIVVYLFGKQYMMSINLLKILSGMPIFIIISNILGFLILMPYGYKKDFSICIRNTLIFNLIIVVPLIYFYKAEGATLVMLLTEICVNVMMLYHVKKRRIVFWR